MINVSSIYKSFNGKDVLRGVDFNIQSGECVVVIGKSGSGKSVLLKHLLGLISPDSGFIKIDGLNLDELTYRELQRVRSKIGMVFQSGALFDSMNVYENLKIAIDRLTNLKQNQIDDRIEQCLDEVGMKETKLLMPSELSGGMKKRVGIARAISFKPDYLFYDEPTTGLDPIMSDTINKLIYKFNKKNKITTLVITHSMKTVFEIADRVLMLNNGKIYFNGSVNDIKNSKDVIISSFVNGKEILDLEYEKQ
ncbi:MAG: ABC transporter ATP-binding protein [Candidatus Marinimicrobia bacterium]|nr:ABC transporter ATP-binding protein [Candidatus Neomarinimicrobiota bacterium]|tara:strand:- start:47 stop:799 length:753 start_codon:yes stop_codon:yes gene_type:complete